MGSVTIESALFLTESDISTHTLRGERDWAKSVPGVGDAISTHTLRGERDLKMVFCLFMVLEISTHTLRGERDLNTVM